MALIKIDEMDGIFETKTERELTYQTFSPEEEAGKTPRAFVRMICGTCEAVLQFHNFVPVLEGEEATPCPICEGPLVV
jgi:hypothetical protein